MDNQQHEWIEVPLHRVGKSTRSGDIYPEHILRDAIEKLSIKYQGRQLFGEISSPRSARRKTPEDNMCRMNSIDYERAAHEIDPASFEIRDDMVFGKIRPVGTESRILIDGLAKNKLSFALRAFISYIDNKPPTVDRCSIVTFDLTYFPL